MNKNSWLIQVSESPRARFWRVDFDQLTLAEQVFRVVWELESEVNNGGFHQYFLNSTGDFAWFAPMALEAIGATYMAVIVRKACSIFPESEPQRDWTARQTDLLALDELADELLETLDQEFCSYPDDLTTLLFNYVAAHRTEIAGTE